MPGPHERVPDRIPLPTGFTAGGICCGLKPDGALDLGLLLAERAVPTAAVFTQNRLLGAHIPVCRDHLERSGGLVRALLVNSKNANCATGRQGIEDARRCCAELARRIGCPTEQVLMVSTGPIGAPLPTERILGGLDELLATASRDGAMSFARSIMTTDTRPKARHGAHGDVEATAFAKGSGMIHPDMATMLAFFTTDGELSAPANEAVRRIADRSMHRVTVDGDTSPNDTLLVMHGGARPDTGRSTEPLLTELGAALARDIARDGEGASRLVTVQVRGARNEAEAARVGRVIATSPLVKTAIAGRDPNWGRIVSAAGRCNVPFRSDRARVWIGDIEVYRDGIPHPECEPRASDHLRNNEHVTIGIDLALGDGTADVWTCDLTADYIRINADYRT